MQIGDVYRADQALSDLEDVREELAELSVRDVRAILGYLLTLQVVT
jgi:hypothetical protein